MTYKAPVRDTLFALHELAGLEAIAAMPGFEAADADTAQAIVDECARLCEGVIAPLNAVGDKQPSSWEGGVVTATPGFKAAYKAFAAGGWQGLQHPAEFGGQGLPKTLATAAIEFVNSANLSFALCPLLTDGAIEALLTAASPELQQRFLPRMISGEWTGSMNLTEPQAGSDLGLVRTRAACQPDGSYQVFGTKIFITWGEHDMADNIVHLVLARVTGAPAGVKGISLFVVPKFLVNGDGSLGDRNDIQCVSIEHKLGIKASPTAVLQFGDGMAASIADSAGPGAVGYLVGEENRGLEVMFVMMNAARFGVGVQGIALAERAYQAAVAYARERVQSRPVDGSAQGAVAIIQHPDVKRMLLTMRSLTEGTRALAYVAATAFDAMHAHPDAAKRRRQQAHYEYLVPLLKGFATEMSLDVASLGIQVHGGMGYIEETGAAQHLRDAKILSIYEGTTAIQANDLVGRKTLRDGGHAARELAAMIEATERELQSQGGATAAPFGQRLTVARRAFLEVVDFVCAHAKGDPNAVFAGAVPYLMLGGTMAVGWQWGRALLAAERHLAAGQDADFMRAKVATAAFYADHLLTRAGGLRDAVVSGSAAVAGFPVDSF